ncbi:MAG: precorrin-8X methylmutase [Pseudomonadota bacterium]
MPLFDRYLIVDWSAANKPVKEANSIWICLAERRDGQVVELLQRNPPTRREAMGIVSRLCHEALQDQKRLFAGFDFAFGYPKGGAHRIARKPYWKELWSVLSNQVQDRADNNSNRFEVADNLNEFAFGGRGPFWGHPVHGRYHSLRPTKPTEGVGVSEDRITERYVSSAKSVWQLYGNGAVGSQTLLGIPALYGLIREPGLAEQIAVWPFETNFERRLDKGITVAEIYPSLFPIKDVEGQICRDQTQVRTLAQGFAKWDAADQFEGLLAAPSDLVVAERDAVIAEEGWIVGAGTYGGTTRQTAKPAETSQVATAGRHKFETNPSAIYKASFATIEKEADLSRFDEAGKAIAVRMIHACGAVGIASNIEVSASAFSAGVAALKNGAPVICDVTMVQRGLLKKALRAKNEVLCFLDQVVDAGGTTKSAAAMDLARHKLEGSVVVIGNAPTALFQLLNRLQEGWPKPALIIGAPVGFVGTVESKAALASDPHGVPFITLHGRMGGSAIAAAAFNAIGLAATGAPRDWAG